LAASGAALVPGLGLAQVRPCAPPMFGVIGDDPTPSTCAQMKIGDVPPWFAAAPDGARIEVAAGANRSDLQPAQRGACLIDRDPGLYAACDDIGGSWTGGCIDQERGEQIFAANGGRGNYCGNEVYALALREEVPTWVRLTDPTPKEYFRLDVVGRAPA